MVANTGTYVDPPFHRYADGLDLSQLPLEHLANLDTVVVRVPTGQRQIGPGYFERLEVAGKAVLVATVGTSTGVLTSISKGIRS